MKDPKHLFPLVGALVVFATFIVKEGIRDNLKDVVSAFENAQTTFALRDQNVRMTTMLTEIRTRVVALNDKSLPKAAGWGLAREPGICRRRTDKGDSRTAGAVAGDDHATRAEATER